MSSPLSLLRPNKVLCVVAIAVIGLWTISGGCPAPPSTTPDGGGGTDGGGTDDGGSDTGGGDTGDGDTGDGGTDGGGDTGGGGGIDDGGGDTGGGDTGGGDTGGGGSDDGSGTDSPAPTSLSWEPVVETGDAVPDQPAGVSFTQFGDPVIDADGRVAFWALYSGSGALGHGGLYVWDSGQLKRVVHDDPATAGIVPQRETADYFGSFEKTGSFDPRDQDVVWGAGDRLLFVTKVAGEKSSVGIYRWRATDDDLQRVVELEQVAALFPDAATNAFAPEFFLPGVTDLGIAIFGIDYLYITPNSQFVNGSGVFTSNGTDITILADTVHSEENPGDVPDRGENYYFGDVHIRTTLNSSGDMVFHANYALSGGSATGRGVYLARGGNLYRVVDTRTGYNWPGLPSNTQVGPVLSPFSVGPNGHIVIETRLTDTQGQRESVIIWDWNTDQWTELVGPNSAPVDNLLSGINDDGHVIVYTVEHPFLYHGENWTRLSQMLPTELQQATDLNWSDDTAALNNAGRAVLAYYYDSGENGLSFWTGTLNLIVADARLGEPVEGVEEVFTITDPRRDRAGRTGLLNDNDELTFRVRLSNDDEAIYIARGQ